MVYDKRMKSFKYFYAFTLIVLNYFVENCKKITKRSKGHE